MPRARLPTGRGARRPGHRLLGAAHQRGLLEITYAAEQLAAEVIRYHRLSTPVVWIEHHPPIATDCDTETFDLVDFSGYEVRERGPYLGDTRLTVGEATWKRITRGMVEVLVGREV